MKRDSRGEERRQKKAAVHLPWELIIGILFRLPVKSLVRFKYVCKLWFSFISDYDFAISHFQLAAAPTNRLVFLEPSTLQIRSTDIDASLYGDSVVAASRLNFPPGKPFYARILGSCRGFLFLDYCQSYCMWNPSTGVHKLVERIPIDDSGVYVLSTFLCGFGYDPSTDDYLVVQAVYNPHDKRITRSEYFSLRTNVWKQIEATHLPYHDCSTTNHLVKDAGLFVKCAIHWLAFRYDISINVIVTFDLTERSFSEIPLPVNFVYDSLRHCILSVLGELLNLCVVGHNQSIEIWEMKEYKVQSSWTKTIVVSVDDFPTRYFFPICFTKCGDIVGRDNRTALMKCNDRGQLQEHREYFLGFQYICPVTVYTESLLSLPCDSEQKKTTNHSKQEN